METASFAGLIETLFYIIAFYYVVKFIARIFLPLLIKKAVDKAGENFTRQQQYYSARTSQQAPPPQNAAHADKPRETKKVGEYVDYEEID